MARRAEPESSPGACAMVLSGVPLTVSGSRGHDK
jgi:hypothetical protein